MLNFNINKLEATLHELANMLTNAEPNLKREKGCILVINSSGSKKRLSTKKKAQKAKATKHDKDIKKGTAKGKCHFYSKEGHWKHNCKAYVSKLNEKKHMDTSTLGTYVIKMHLSTASSSTWVLDIRCGSHICVNMQMLRSSRRLAKNEMVLRMGNGAKVLLP